jgi:hypothetical protein
MSIKFKNKAIVRLRDSQGFWGTEELQNIYLRENWKIMWKITFWQQMEH